MKKISFIAFILSILLITGCGQGNKQTDITNTNIDIESCNKYFKMIDCIINKEKDDKYSDNMREEIKQEIKRLQSERENENEETVDNLCIKELGKYNNNEAIAELKKIGCFMD